MNSEEESKIIAMCHVCLKVEEEDKWIKRSKEYVDNLLNKENYKLILTICPGCLEY